ncbi:MAG: hypothetical protein DRP11_05340 [Candidatus Aenigmatarchaeota archaeon]|nr:MAG: hypothetical protein DRP11_05340 [Candidatus Aenigmarchaeota archaeon]
MEFSDILRNLKIDTWYKAFVYLGGLVLAISFFVEAKGITNTQLQLLSAGIFFFGIGEWKNHKLLVEHRPTVLIQYPIRKPDFFGVILELIGTTLIILSIWSIIKK